MKRKAAWLSTQTVAESSQTGAEKALQGLKDEFVDAISAIKTKSRPVPLADTRALLERASSSILSTEDLDRDLLHYVVALPMTAFTPLAITAGVETWTAILKQRKDAEVTIFSEITSGWLDTIRKNKGLFNTSMKCVSRSIVCTTRTDRLSYKDPFEVPIEYSPSDKKTMDLELSRASKMLRPHHLLIKVLSTQYQAMQEREPGVTVSLIRLLMRSLGAAKKMRYDGSSEHETVCS